MKTIKAFILPFLKKNMIIALILIMIVLSFTVTEKNENTVNKLVMDTSTTFISVSIIKGAADMIEGSTLFGIEVGDVVQPVLDSVSVIWKFLLCALAFWGCMKLFITLPAVLAIGLLILAIAAYIMNKGMARFIMFCSFVCSLIPFIIFGTGLIMNFCTEPLREEAQEHFARVSAIFDMTGLEREMVEEEKYEQGQDAEHWYDWITRKFNSATIIISQTKNSLTFFKEKALEILHKRNYIMNNLVNGTWKYIVVLLMNSIIIPGLLFIFFFKLGKSLQPEEKPIVIQAPPSDSVPKLIAAE